MTTVYGHLAKLYEVVDTMDEISRDTKQALYEAKTLMYRDLARPKECVLLNNGVQVAARYVPETGLWRGVIETDGSEIIVCDDCTGPRDALVRATQEVKE